MAMGFRPPYEAVSFSPIHSSGWKLFLLAYRERVSRSLAMVNRPTLVPRGRTFELVETVEVWFLRSYDHLRLEQAARREERSSPHATPWTTIAC